MLNTVEKIEREQERPSYDEMVEAIRKILVYAGEDPTREGLVDTPDRYIRAMDEFFAGYQMDPVAMLERTFEETEGYEDMVVLSNIRFESHCEHHMVPIIGVVHVGYIPKDRVVGISKLARVVDAYAKRFQIQEKMTSQIANTINDVLEPKGVGVIVEAQHQCMTTRGIRKTDASMVTRSLMGEIRDNMDTRREFFSLIGK